MPTIDRVDPHDDARLRAWYAAWRSGAAAGRARPLIAAYAALRASLREPGSAAERSAWAAVEDGEVVGALLLGLYGQENRGVAEVEVSVPTARRGRGHGSVLFSHAERAAARSGRSVLLSEAHGAPDEAPGATPGERFALARGFRVVHVEEHLVLDLPGPGAPLDAPAAPRGGEHRIDTWSGACPEAFLDAFTRMRTESELAVPAGDVGFAPRGWDADRVRAVQARMQRQGFTGITSMARAADGSPAGYSELFTTGHDPVEVYQGTTLVLPAHRGAGLGAALKRRNLELLRAGHPAARRVHTWTDPVNDPMRAINRRFGFRPVELARRLQRDAH